MHVKCLLISLKWPEKTIDTLLAYCNLRTENEVVLNPCYIGAIQEQSMGLESQNILKFFITSALLFPDT